MNVTFGEVATFDCSGIGDSLNWTVDGVDVHQMTTEMIELLGIKILTTKEPFIFYLNRYIFQSTVNITANCFTNYTSVKCIVRGCWYQVSSSGGVLQVEGTLTNNYYLASRLAGVEEPKVIGNDSLLLHLYPVNATYRIVVNDLNTSTTVSSLDVFGNSNVYTLKVPNASPCHIYNMSMEILYLGRCTAEVVTSSVVTFDASKGIQTMIMTGNENFCNFFCHTCMYITTEFPFKVDNNSIVVDCRPDDPLVNISFKVYTHVTVI